MIFNYKFCYPLIEVSAWLSVVSLVEFYVERFLPSNHVVSAMIRVAIFLLRVCVAVYFELLAMVMVNWWSGQNSYVVPRWIVLIWFLKLLGQFLELCLIFIHSREYQYSHYPIDDELTTAVGLCVVLIAASNPLMDRRKVLFYTYFLPHLNLSKFLRPK